MAAQAATTSTTWLLLKEAQQRRCAVLHEWDSHFSELLRGGRATSEYESILLARLLPELARVNNEIVALRDDPTVPMVLRRVAKRLQDAEKERFDATMQRQRLLVEHVSSQQYHNSDCITLMLVDSRAYPMKIRREGGHAIDDESDAAAATAAPHGAGGGCGCAGQEERIRAARANCAEVGEALARHLGVIRSSSDDVAAVMEELQMEVSDAAGGE